MPFNAPKPSILTFLTVISRSSPSLIFLLSTSFFGSVITMEPPTFLVFTVLINITSVTKNNTKVTYKFLQNWGQHSSTLNTFIRVYANLNSDWAIGLAWCGC